MKFAALSVIALLAIASGSHGPDTSHPVGKVIRMLQGLSMKVEMDAKQEALTYEKFTYWVKNSEKTLSEAIAKSKDEVEEFTSSIESKEQQEKTLTDEIADLDDEILGHVQSAKKALDIREETAKAYTEAKADFDSTVTAITEAIGLLDASKTVGFAQLLNKPAMRTALSLLEAAVPMVEQRGALAALLQGSTSSAPAPDKDRPDLIVRGGLEEHVQKYAFKSGKVIELLKQLKLKFEDERTAAVTAETNSLNAYALEKQARDASKKAAEDSNIEKEKLRGEVQGDLVQLRTDLKSSQDDLAADSATLVSTKKISGAKAAEWSDREATRTQEREAMAMAIKILAKVSGVRTEAPSNPVPPASPLTSLLQLPVQSPADKVMSLLRSASRATHSKALARLADEIAINPHGHFGAVVNSIEKMIFKLQDEQTDEDKHKAWCDLELSKSKTSEQDKVDKAQELSEKIQLDKALIQKLTEDISDADAMVADVTSFMQQATEIRATGKKENAVAIKDSEDAQEAVANAVAVLDAFYKQSGMIETKSWEFVQQPVDLPATPSTWDASYTGIADPKNQPSGIVTMLETVAADFAKMEAETRAQEATDQSEYDEQIKESTIEKARRAKESEMKNLEKKGTVDRMSDLEKRKKHTNDELDAVRLYLKDLEPACVNGDSTYADRKAARAEEITALHEAQGILADAFKKETAATSFLSIRRHVVA